MRNVFRKAFFKFRGRRPTQQPTGGPFRIPRVESVERLRGTLHPPPIPSLLAPIVLARELESLNLDRCSARKVFEDSEVPLNVQSHVMFCRM